MKAERSAYWDNLKGILIILVVLGHFFYAYRSDEMIEMIVEVIYVFHMPVFVFVSGYLSKVYDKIPVKSIVQLFVSYVLVNTMMMLYSYFVLDQSIKILKPYYSCWYLIALILWRIILSLVHKYKFILPFSIIMAFAVGLTNQINNDFALARTIVFFPFFIVGYMTKINRPIKGERGIKVKLVGYLLITVVIMCCVKCNQIYNFTIPQELMSAYSESWRSGMFERLILMMLASAMLVAMLMIVPDKKVMLLTKWGRNSLTIYLFHRILSLLLLFLLPKSNYSVEYLPILCVVSFVVLLVLGTDWFAQRYQTIISGITDIIFIQNDSKVLLKKHILLACFLAGVIVLLFEEKTGYIKALM